MKEKEKAKIRKGNMKLFPIYQMIGADLMFFYAIQILYLLQVKHFEASEAVLLGSFYALFATILYIPLTMLVSKIGKRNGMILGNIFNLVYILMWIFCSSYTEFIVAEFFSAFAFGLKNLTENTFLNESIPNVKRKPDIFTKISGKAYANYSYFAAVATFVSGLLYDVNPYIPLVCAAICIAGSIVISANFVDLEKIAEPEKPKNKKHSSPKEIYNDLKSSLIFIFKSKRLRALLLMMGVCWGLFRLADSYQTTLLESIGCSASFIGGFAALLELLKGYSAQNANKFNKSNKNKSLTIIGLTITIGLMVSGLILLIDIPFETQLLVIVVAFTLIYERKGIYQIIKGRYLNSFTTPDILTKIYSVNGVTDNISRMIITYIGSLILTRNGDKVCNYCYRCNIYNCCNTNFKIHEN